MKGISYLIALAIVLGQAYVFHQNKVEQNHIEEEVLKSLEEGISFLVRRNNEIQMQIKFDLEDETKRRYRPISKCMEQIRKKNTEKYNKIRILSYEHALDPQTLKKLLHSIYQESIDEYQSLLYVNRSSFGLRSEDVYMRLTQLKKHLKRLKQNQDLITQHNKILEKEILLEKLAHDIFLFENILLKDLAILSGGKGCFTYYSIYPTVKPIQNIVKKGETFKAAISFHRNYMDIMPEDICLKINGEDIYFSDNQIAFFESKPLQESETLVTFEITLRNNWTGEFQEPYQAFYTIKTID